MNDSEFRNLCAKADKAQCKAYEYQKAVYVECRRRWGDDFNGALEADCCQLPDIFLNGCPTPEKLQEAVEIYRKEWRGEV